MGTAKTNRHRRKQHHPLRERDARFELRSRRPSWLGAEEVFEAVFLVVELLLPELEGEQAPDFAAELGLALDVP